MDKIEISHAGEYLQTVYVNIFRKTKERLKNIIIKRWYKNYVLVKHA